VLLGYAASVVETGGVPYLRVARTLTELVAGLPRLCHPRGYRAGIALDEAAEDGHLLVASAVSYRKTGLESQGNTSLI
jgi:hypothetical protein